MTTKLLAFLLLGALAAVPATSAQNASGLSISGANDAVMVPIAGTDLSYTVTVGCAEFLQQASQSIAVALSSDLPAYYGASSDGATLSPAAGCIPGGSVSATAVLKIRPTADAMGLEPMPFKVTATAGSLNAVFDHTESIQIAYVDGHSLTTDVDFPYNFTAADGESLVFNITIDITANSKTMVMFENVGASGKVEGLFHQIFDLMGGDERQRVLQVTYTPPTGAWTNDTITFYNYSHCLNGSPCGATNEQNITWTIFNDGASAHDDDRDEESPGLPLFALLAAVVAVALRRRG